jgi:hypothetical protein
MTTRQALAGAAITALVLTGCGDASERAPTGEAQLRRLARSIEEQAEVMNARCHPARHGDGHHFYCLVSVGGRHKFKLGVVEVAGKERPLITSCEVAMESKRANVMSTCALSEPAG